MDNEKLVGRVVWSKAGRDKGKTYIIVETLDDKYVLVCDGEARNLERPKKKKLMHLSVTDSVFSGENINDSNIANFLRSYDKIKEVRLPYVKR
jgi:ribosomal protein L14E/L6E/L27E